MKIPRLSALLPCPLLRLALAALAVALCTLGCDRPAPPPARPAAEVAAVTVTPRSVPVSTRFVARIESSHQVEILSRVNGFLEKISYREGDTVKAGQVMFRIDPKPFQAQVDAAKGEVASREAQLWTARANLDRIKPLAALDAASQSDLDNALGQVQAAEAALHSAQAHLSKTELDLGYTVIKAPVTGLAGQALVREGSYLSAGGSGHLSYVAAVDPLWVTFSISQNQLDEHRRDVAAGRLILPPDGKYTVELELGDGSRYPHPGTVDYADPVYNTATGTFQLRAVIANPQGVLRPGMFVSAWLKGVTRPDALVVPQKAVQETANGHVVFIASPQGTVEVRPVIVGDWVGNDWVIRQGLSAGEQVIVDGFQRLAPGAPVKVAAAPAAAAGGAR